MWVTKASAAVGNISQTNLINENVDVYFIFSGLTSPCKLLLLFMDSHLTILTGATWSNAINSNEQGGNLERVQ